MTGRRPPRLALALLEHFVPDNPALAGDLIEELEAGRSRAWFWWQVVGAVTLAVSTPAAEIRPLRLVELQPADAQERSRRVLLRPAHVNPSGSPVSTVGGLGLIVLGFLVSIVSPGAWWLVGGSVLAGIALGVLLIVLHRRPLHPTSIALR